MSEVSESTSDISEVEKLKKEISKLRSVLIHVVKYIAEDHVTEPYFDCHATSKWDAYSWCVEALEGLEEDEYRMGDDQ